MRVAAWLRGQSDKPSDDMHQTQNVHNPYGSEDCLITAFWQTLVGNLTPTSEVALSAFQCLLQCELELPGCGKNTGVWRGRATLDQLMRVNRHF